MATAKPREYLSDVVSALKAEWPGNRNMQLVFHGHSVPAGYFATPVVDTFNAYPHLLHRMLKRRFPNAVINVIVTALGGENSASGAERFSRDVLTHRPDVVFIDYALNDRSIGLDKAAAAWRCMISAAMDAGAKVILLTPTSDETCAREYVGPGRDQLPAHAAQVRALAAEYGVGLVDSFAAFERYGARHDVRDLLSWVNHPNRKGHAMVARALARWFAVP